MRQAHWIKENKQERIPPRMVAFDTESRSYRSGDVETQTWRIGCAIRWRTDLKTSDHAEGRVFSNPADLWQWVSDYGRKGTRTVVWAHNLSHDVRISQALTILPTLGYEIEWCNLDQNVSAIVWRSDHGTIVMADTYTWVPLSLAALAPSVKLVKFDMPQDRMDDDTWSVYCMNDARIVYRIASELCGYIRSAGLGNWQPTGAGMAYATWRHKFMKHKVLVHDDVAALQAERSAMYTGRAEAWKHGRFAGHPWTEVDMRNAYVTIGHECELPRKLHMHTNQIGERQYASLVSRYRVLCRCTVRCDLPVLPYRQSTKTLWPIGTWQGWYWDTEVDCARRYGAQVKIHETYCYTRAPVLHDWADWILGILRYEHTTIPPIVKTWLKHCTRAMIGRLALQTKSWELFGANPDGDTGITHMVDCDTGITHRLMHVGDKTLIESDTSESENSVPMITGWIMAECRVRLWEAMNAAGLENLAHVDTDSLLVNGAGLAALKQAAGAAWPAYWQVKGSWATIDLSGPRHYHRGRERVISGIPRRAAPAGDGRYTGERWASAATDLESRGDGVVTTWLDEWTETAGDPRRKDRPGVSGETDAYEVGLSSASSMSVMPSDAAGE